MQLALSGHYVVIINCRCHCLAAIICRLRRCRRLSHRSISPVVINSSTSRRLSRVVVVFLTSCRCCSPVVIRS
jgi:hypothetical protein